MKKQFVNTLLFSEYPKTREITQVKGMNDKI